MEKHSISLNSREWSEVSLAFEESSRRAPARRPAPRSAAALLDRVASLVLGPRPPEEPDTPKRQALRRFVAATLARQGLAEEHVPALLSFGLNRRQVEALVMLHVPKQRPRVPSAVQ